ncbi:hypothetical protein ANAEL_01242 [Anaerolineales bacterium]|nr:hypothetical protein ANAEL_01242 [Anaerolineales bacterium]
MNDWNSQLETEFERAKQARVKKNEGKARVCARRAAGIAVRAYLTRKGIQVPNMSAYDLLNLLRENLELPPEMQSTADHLTMRVNEDFQLPIDTDLVAEARVLCDWLMNEN